MRFICSSCVVVVAVVCFCCLPSCMSCFGRVAADSGSGGAGAGGGGGGGGGGGSEFFNIKGDLLFGCSRIVGCFTVDPDRRHGLQGTAMRSNQINTGEISETYVANSRWRSISTLKRGEVKKKLWIGKNLLEMLLGEKLVATVLDVVTTSHLLRRCGYEVEASRVVSFDGLERVASILQSMSL